MVNFEIYSLCHVTSIVKPFCFLVQNFTEIGQCRGMANNDFYRAMLCISAAIAGMRCPSVRLSVCLTVTFVSCAKTNKDIFKIVSPSVAKPF